MKRILVATLAGLGLAGTAFASDGGTTARSDSGVIYQGSGQNTGGPARERIPSAGGSGSVSTEGTVWEQGRSTLVGVSGSGQRAGGPAAEYYSRAGRGPRSVEGTVADPNRPTPFWQSGSGQGAGGPLGR